MFYLVRHGQTDWNINHRIQGHLDMPLNDTGRNEAAVCAKQLAAVKIDQIISSDLSRAKETANIINKTLSVPIRFDSRLREINMGDLQGVLVQDMTDETWDIFNHEPHKVHAESLEDVYKRVKSFFDDMDKMTNTLVVTHGGVVRMTKYLSQNPNFFDQAKFEEIAIEFKIKNTEVFQWNGAQSFTPLEEKIVSG